MPTVHLHRRPQRAAELGVKRVGGWLMRVNHTGRLDRSRQYLPSSCAGWLTLALGLQPEHDLSSSVESASHSAALL